MLVDDFLSFLNKREVDYTTNDQSVILAEAPCCGGHNKVYLYKEDSDPGRPIYGKCMKCDQAWNSYTYLSELGFDDKEIDILHGMVELKNLELGMINAIDFNLFQGKAKAKTETAYFDVNHYYPLEEVADHEASKYAISRGWTIDRKDDILVDIYSNSVVFVVRDAEGNALGYQKRFLVPPRPEMKVQSAKGFKKTQHILQYPNNGDILVCEGPFTALSAWHYGYHAVCTFGAGVSEKQIQLIIELAKKTGKKVGVSFDLDKAGQKGYRIIATAMHWEHIPVFVVKPEVGNDLNDSWKAGKGIQLLPPDTDDITIPELPFSVEDFL